MAKLNVVIPAVDVMVDGVTYRKVDRKAQAGDIVKALESLPDIDRGEFYGPVTGVTSGKIEFADNDDFPRSRPITNYEVYAPISAPAAQPPTDTITFQGATWRKVDRDVREGDAIKFTDDDRSHYLTESELYVVNEVDFNSDPHITDDDEDSYDAGWDDYEIYEKVADSAAQEYREVKRKANVGERIKTVEKQPGDYAIGDVFTVTDADRWEDGTGVSVNEVSTGIYHREYVVLEPVTMSAGTTQPERLAVGDYARVVERGHHAFNYGDIVEIIGTDDSRVPYHAKALTNGSSGWASASRLVRATDEEVAAAKYPRSQFAAGDKVRLISGGSCHPLNGFSDGEVYTVNNPKDKHHNGDRVEIRLSSGTTGYAYPNQLVKLTAAEIAEFERKQAEEAAKRAEETKWSAIGRRVNEYKRGDIVEIIGNSNFSVNKVGNIGTIDSVRSGAGRFQVDAGNGTRSNWTIPNEMRLIVPVEQRFDREVDAA